MQPNNGEELVRSYLRPTGARRARCQVFELNPDFDGVLKMKARARKRDPETSHDAAASIKIPDIYESKIYVDILLARNGTITSNEFWEYVEEGIAAGTISARGESARIRANSIRRRFSDFCPSNRKPRVKVKAKARESSWEVPGQPLLIATSLWKKSPGDTLTWLLMPEKSAFAPSTGTIGHNPLPLP